MEVFEGTVRVAGEATSLPAVLLVADNRLKVATRRSEIGNWDLTEVSASLHPDGCHVAVEGEALIVSVPDPVRFAVAIGPRWTNPGDGSLVHGRRRTSTAPEPEASHRWGAAFRLMQLKWAIGGSGLALAILLGLLAPTALIILILLVSLSGLLVGGFALMDQFVAVRLPDPLTPTLLIMGGAAGLALAILLAIAL